MLRDYFPSLLHLLFHASEGKVSVGLPKHSVSSEGRGGGGHAEERRGGEKREEEEDWRPLHTCKV